MCELDRDDLIRRRDHFTALGSKDRAAYDMALRTHDAEKRAQAAESMLEVEREEARHALQRAEADNARLRKALRELSFAAQTTGGVAGRDEGVVAKIEKAHEALATPPPESEPPTQHGKDIGAMNAHELTVAMTGDAHPTPEQTGSALANLSTLKGEALRGVTTESGRSKVLKCEKNVREALEAPTASGVPSVPESIRELPENWRLASRTARRQMEPSVGQQISGVYSGCADELEAALKGESDG